MKAAGILMIMASCSGLGFHMAFLLGRRIGECQEAERCILALAGELRCRRLPLAEALESVGKSEKSRFGGFFMKVAGRLQALDGGSFRLIWSQELDRYLEDSLFREEAELLYGLGRQLGYLDLEEQLTILFRFQEQWRMHMESLRAEAEKKERLYRCLGVFAGFFLAILLL